MNGWDYGIKKLAAVNSELAAGLKQSVISDAIIYDSQPSGGAGTTEYEFFTEASQHGGKRTNISRNRFEAGEAMVVYAISFVENIIEFSAGPPVEREGFNFIDLNQSSGQQIFDVNFIIGNKRVIKRAVVDPTRYASLTKLGILYLDSPVVIPPLVEFSVTATFNAQANPLGGQFCCGLFGFHAMLNLGGAIGGLRPWNAAKSNDYVTDAVGAPTVRQQSTSMRVYDTETPNPAGSAVKFFNNFSGKTLAQTNMLRNMLDSSESLVLKDIKIVTGPLFNDNLYGQGDFKLFIGNQQVIKYLPLGWLGQSQIHPDREVGYSDDAVNLLHYRLKTSSLVIPANVEFRCEMENLATDADDFFRLTLGGFGKLFNVGKQL